MRLLGHHTGWKSALTAALYRMSLDELAVSEGKTPLTAHWDIKKYYDNIDIAKLIDILFKFEFPLRAPILALQMHLAPRI